MKVQATRQGFYDQVLRDPGEVFELIDEIDGTPPLRMIRTETLKDGKPTGDYTETVYMDSEGNVMHRDFAPDHEELTGRGVFKGDTFSPGWMRQVPDDTPIGLYEPETRFAMDGKQLPQPITRIIKPGSEPLNAPRATPMRGKASDRQRRA